MNFKDCIDLMTGSGAVLSSLGALMASLVAVSSSRASKLAAQSSQTALELTERIAENDRRIRLLNERMKVWSEFSSLIDIYEHLVSLTMKRYVEAKEIFQTSTFLFDPEVEKFLMSFLELLMMHSSLRERLKASVSGTSEREKNADLLLLGDLESSLNAKFVDGRQLFIKHMSLI